METYEWLGELVFVCVDVTSMVYLKYNYLC